MSLLVWATSLTSVLLLVLFAVLRRKAKVKAVGFFHPFTNDGGGGERVLWCAVKAVQEKRSDLTIVVYTGDHDATPEGLEMRARDRFGVKLLAPPEV